MKATGNEHVFTFIALLWVLVLAAAAPLPAQEMTGNSSPVADLMKRKLYKEAIDSLLREIKDKPEDAMGLQYLMLGECYYAEDMYNEARPYLAKAFRNLPDGREKTIAEYRIACVSYNIKDTEEAFQRTESFVKKYPKDKRGATLLLYRMKALSARGKGAAADLESVRARIRAAVEHYGTAPDVAADKILTDYYMKNGLQERAVQGYINIVRNFQAASQQYAAEGKPVPAALEQAHDHAAMSLASLYVEQKNYPEATKWLDGIRFDAELRLRARLMLAQIAYQKQDYRGTERYLLENDFISTVPEGPLLSDMYLLLGFCAKRAPQPKLENVEKYFGRVTPDSAGYWQAQMGLADSYEKWLRTDKAIELYERAVGAPKFEVTALAKLGDLYFQNGQKEKSDAGQKEFFQKAADRFTLLAQKYPSSQEAKQAGDSIKILKAKGFAVKLAMTDDQLVQEWETIVTNRTGTAEAARALAQIMVLHSKQVSDPKSGRVVKAPDYPACVDACNRLLDEKVYNGRDMADVAWKNMRAEALYYRAFSQVASVGQHGGGDGKYVEKPDLAQAVFDMDRASELADPRQQDLIQGIEITRLEAMFKSDEDGVRKKGRELYAAMAEKYSQNPRFQKLAYDLAQWYQDQHDFVSAARGYKAIADRGVNLSQDDLVKLVFAAGNLYSRAAADMRKTAKKKQAFAIYVYPKEVVELAGMLKTHEPFQTRVKLAFTNAPEVSAGEALGIVSQAARIPFVWSREGGANSIAEYLGKKRVVLSRGEGTVEEYLKDILDPDFHVLDFDIGLTGAQPTVPPPTDAELEDPEVGKRARRIEIYDRRSADRRYSPLCRSYGPWGRAHGQKTMMFAIAERIRQLSETDFQWADGVNKEDILANEFDRIPGVDPDRDCSLATALAEVLGRIGYRYKIVPRDPAAECYDAARSCFNEVYRLAPRSAFGEKSMFQLALNYYQQTQYEKMKLTLQQYLRTFDSPTYEHYHQACFWIGWTFEHDKRWREAGQYYKRAAEEQLVIYAPPTNSPPPTREEILDRLAYDTRVALEDPVDGAAATFGFPNEFINFIRLYTSLNISVDPSVQAGSTNVSLGPLHGKLAVDLLAEVLGRFDLSFRGENLNKDIAEKAYFRLAACLKREGLPDPMLATCRVLLARYPGTSRKPDVYRFMLDAYKGLKDYRNVLATLHTMKQDLAGRIEPYLLNFELGAIYFDLARYEESAANFRQALANAPTPADRLKIREGLARALFQAGRFGDAANEYRTLCADETEPLRAFVHQTMVWLLDRMVGRTLGDELSPEASALMKTYEAAEPSQASPETLARVSWLYYAAGRLDLHRGEASRALEKFTAAGNSSDDWLAAEALFQAALLHLRDKRLTQARETLEYLLFSTKSAEGELKAYYHLGLCKRQMGLDQEAETAFDQVLRKFPDSSFAGQILADRERRAREAAGTNRVGSATATHDAQAAGTTNRPARGAGAANP